MEKNEIMKTLTDAGWKRTVSSPPDVLDYTTHEPYNRVIIFPIDFEELTPERLKYLMDTPMERRDLNV